MLATLASLLESTLAEHRYLRTRWSSELLGTVRRWLVRPSNGYRRARPTPCIRDPRNTQRMRAVCRALNNQSKDHEALDVDEADVDLNPRMGPAWMPRGTTERRDAGDL